MTTDITELAQSLKRRATSANEFGESLYVKADDILTLVDALEKAQHRIGEMEARMAMAAMDSEPVIIVGDDGGDALSYRRLIQSFEPGTKLYRHPQPAAGNLSRIFAESYQVIGALAEALNIFNELPVIKALDNLSAQELIHDDVLPFSVPEDGKQAQVSVPDEIQKLKDGRGFMYVKDGVHYSVNYANGWNQCRAAMLHAGNSPAQSDCCQAQNVVSPAQSPIDHGYQPECECSGCKATARICTEMAVNSLVIPNEMTSEQAYEIGYYYGDPVDVFARGANWMRQHIIDSTLAASPQSPGSEHATVPGKWIPVSELMPEVGDIVLTAMGGVVNVGEMECSAANCRFFTSVISGRELPATYWMPLPAAPQEE